MKCPYCEGEMAEGTAFIKGTLWGFLVIGLSIQHLWFRRADDRGPEKIIHSNGSGVTSPASGIGMRDICCDLKALYLCRAK